jgi:ribosomal protein S12 methylthiotransferase
MTLQSEISERLNKKKIGSILPVLVEGFSFESDLLLRGRLASMAPDVDGQVLITQGESAAGEVMPVRVEEAYAYDLIGRIVR